LTTGERGQRRDGDSSNECYDWAHDGPFSGSDHAPSYADHDRAVNSPFGTVASGRGSQRTTNRSPRVFNQSSKNAVAGRNPVPTVRG
jgi:hypothetical protein